MNGSTLSVMNPFMIVFPYRSRNFDQFTFQNDDFLILVAAGNSGEGDAMNTVGSPATAKNVISVGSHHSWGSSLPMGMLGPSYVSGFSSRGPTSDGRMKPVSMLVCCNALSNKRLQTLVYFII